MGFNSAFKGLKVLIPLLKLFNLLIGSFLDCWCNLPLGFFLPVFPSVYKAREGGANIMGVPFNM